jgi:hypothetical protein
MYSTGEDIIENDGIGPEMLLYDRSRITSDELLNRVEGIFPLSMFLLRSRNLSDEQFANIDGIPPVRLLF